MTTPIPPWSPDPLWGKNRLEPRPDWDTYFLAGARWVSSRADCRRARHGCLLVVDHRIVAAGYNGAPPGYPKSCLRGECPRGMKVYAELPGHSDGGGGNHDYSDCIALHAEANAIGDAAARGNAIRGATAYITSTPCDACAKLLIAAGITRVVTPDFMLTETHLRGMLP